MNIQTYTQQVTVAATNRLKLPHEVNNEMNTWNKVAHMFHAKATFIPGIERPVTLGPFMNWTQTITVTIEGDCNDPKCQELFDVLFSNDFERLRSFVEKELSSGSATNNNSDPENSTDKSYTRNIQKNTVPQSRVIAVNSSDTAPLLKRIFMFLEDGDWDRADEYCETVLDLDPENAYAYLGKLMAELHVRVQDGLKDCEQPFDDRNNYQKAMRFADSNLQNTLRGYISYINKRNENASLESIYWDAYRTMNSAQTEEQFKSAASKFSAIRGYKDSAVLSHECWKKAEAARKDAIYDAAKKLMSGSQISNYQDAIKQFEKISDWKDSSDQIAACMSKIAEIQSQNERERKKSEARAKKYKKIAIIVTPIFYTVIAFVAILTMVIVPNKKYNDAVALMQSGQNLEALSGFMSVSGYKDVEDQISTLMYQIGARETISAGDNHTVGLKADGTVVAVGDNDECNVEDWKDIVAISAGEYHTVGLKADRTVVAVGDYNHGEYLVENWTDIVAISAGGRHTVGLKADGTVVATVRYNENSRCDVENWTDIVAISTGSAHTAGLKADGTVVAVGDNDDGQCDVEGWTDIVAISVGGDHTVGLKADGTVVAVGNSFSGQRNVENWTDIIAISAGAYHAVGLKANGTVVAVGWNKHGQCNVENWTDIIAISAGEYHTVGLKADGTVVAVGGNWAGQCDVEEWKSIKVPN